MRLINLKNRNFQYTADNNKNDRKFQKVLNFLEVEEKKIKVRRKIEDRKLEVFRELKTRAPGIELEL